jgi:hypothetical protein
MCGREEHGKKLLLFPHHFPFIDKSMESQIQGSQALLRVEATMAPQWFC